MFRRTDPYAPITVRSTRTARRALTEAEVLSTYATPTERTWARRHLAAAETWLDGKDTTRPRLARLARTARTIRAAMTLDGADDWPLAA